MNPQPLVSVIIPCYNSAAYVAQAVQSILDQSYRNLEVILVDDGSTDGTVALIDELMRRDDRIRPILRDTPSGRPAIARNAGLDHASGEFVCFLDSDDYCHPTRIQKLVNLLLERTDSVAAFHDMEVVDAEGRFIERFLETFTADAHDHLSRVGDGIYLCGSRFFVFQSIYYGGMATQSVMVAVERLGRGHVYFDPRYRIGEDKDLWIRIGLAGRVIFLNEMLSSYRQHPTSITRDRIRYLEDVIFFMEDNFSRWAAAMTPEEQRKLQGTIAGHYAELAWRYRINYTPSKSVRAYVGAWRWSGTRIHLYHALKSLFPTRR